MRAQNRVFLPRSFCAHCRKDAIHYHLLFQHNITFETLNKDVKRAEQAPRTGRENNNTSVSIEHRSSPLWDVDKITRELMQHPVETYTAILGEPIERNASHLRYSGGLIIATKGADAGKWYSFTEETGGAPIGAIQKYLGLSFPDALAHGASIAGLSEYEAKITGTPLMSKRPALPATDPHDAQKRNAGITSAQSIWQGTTAIEGTLAARYFMEHRGVDSLDGMAIRYWPKGATWIDFDVDGTSIEKPNKIPAAVIAARNAKGDVVSVQRIYLDEKTAGKNTFLKEAKLTKGSNKGAPGVIQAGTPGGTLYIAEGPETAASIALLDRHATVLTSFSVSNIANMADVIKTYTPLNVIIAADNDGPVSAARKTTEKACQTLRQQGIDARVVYPEMLPDRIKTDWNDILVEQGVDVLARTFKDNVAQTQFLYERAAPITGTLAANYFEKSPSALDLTDVRFTDGVHFKGHPTSAMLLPRYNAQGLLCGETILALSADGRSVVGEGQKEGAREGFYIAQRGQGDVLIIADTLIDAKKAALRNAQATVVLSRLDNYPKLHEYLSTQGIKPNKMMIVTDNHDRESQMKVAELGRAFYTNGASMYFIGRDDNITRKTTKTTKLSPVSLEKARLKMGFEKLLNQQPAADKALEKQAPQARFDVLKKEYPLLSQYERDAKECKQVQGYAREKLDKNLLLLAKAISDDKHLFKILQRDIPKLAEAIVHRIRKEQERGIKR